MAAGRLERGTLAAVMLVVAAPLAVHGGEAVSSGVPASRLRLSELPAGQPPTRPPQFVATYTIAWHGITAGTSTLELRATAAQLYLYTSTDRAYGVFRLAFPHPLRQSSRFKITAGAVEPLTFQAGGIGQDVMVQFDWKSGHATGMAKGRLLDLRLQPGTQDPLSLQIALMLQLEAQHPPTSFWMLNTDEIDRFQYVRHAQATLDTPLGKLHTILYTSHAPGSDRTTYLWLAPALEYMPARAEQRVKGSTQLSLEIRAFTPQK